MVFSKPPSPWALLNQHWTQSAQSQQSPQRTKTQQKNSGTTKDQESTSTENLEATEILVCSENPEPTEKPRVHCGPKVYRKWRGQEDPGCHWDFRVHREPRAQSEERVNRKPMAMENSEVTENQSPQKTQRPLWSQSIQLIERPQGTKISHKTSKSTENPEPAKDPELTEKLWVGLTFRHRGFGQLNRDMSLSNRAGKLQKGHLIVEREECRGLGQLLVMVTSFGAKWLSYKRDKVLWSNL